MTLRQKRMIAGLIDFFVTTMIQAAFMMVFVIMPLVNGPLDAGIAFSLVVGVTFMSLIYLVIRDVPGGRSIGKRFMKLVVTDGRSGRSPHMKQLILRNITWFFGPVEVIAFLFLNVRLGDRLAGTDVVEPGSAQQPR